MVEVLSLLTEWLVVADAVCVVVSAEDVVAGLGFVAVGVAEGKVLIVASRTVVVDKLEPPAVAMAPS